MIAKIDLDELIDEQPMCEVREFLIEQLASLPDSEQVKIISKAAHSTDVLLQALKANERL